MVEQADFLEKGVAARRKLATFLYRLVGLRRPTCPELEQMGMVCPSVARGRGTVADTGKYSEFLLRVSKHMAFGERDSFFPASSFPHEVFADWNGLFLARLFSRIIGARPPIVGAMYPCSDSER